MGKKRGFDRLTDQQRRYVDARLAHPEWPKRRCAEHAGIKSASRAAYVVERLPQVRIALAVKTKDPATGKMPEVTKEWLIAQMRKLYDDRRTPAPEKIRLLKEMGAATAGFYVPVGVHHSGKVGRLEQWVEDMGGKPAPVGSSAPEEEKETLQ